MSALDQFETSISIFIAAVRSLLRGVEIVSMMMLVFGLSFAQSTWGRGEGDRGVILTFQSEAPTPQQPLAGDIHFQLIMSGRAGGKGVDSVDVSIYKADDGVLLQHRLEIYHSPSQAQDKMQNMIEKAKKVVERGTKLDNLGKTIGERVVLVTERSDAAVVWRGGRYLYIIRSKRLDHAQAFENHLDQSRPKYVGWSGRQVGR